MPDASDSCRATTSCLLLLRCQHLLTANLSLASTCQPVPSPLVLHPWRLLTANLSASCCADTCCPPAPWPLSFVSHPPLITPHWFGWLSCHLLSHSSCYSPAPALPLSTGDYATCCAAALCPPAPQPPDLRCIPPPPTVGCKLIVVLLSCGRIFCS